MKISVIGAGAMGGAMVQGMIKGKTFANTDITVADPSAKALEQFDGTGTKITTDNAQAATTSDIVAVVVKPWLVESVLKGIKDNLDYSRQLLIVVAAGVSSAQIREWLEKGDGTMIPLFLVIPNTAIAVMNSMTFVVPVGASEEQTAIVKALFDEMGSTLVTEERLLAAGTTLASCGIAYALRYIRSSMEGGVELGIRADDAKHIVMQTLRGAVDVLAASDAHPEAEIDRVTTPGGLTIRGLNAMEAAGFTHSVIEGLRASTKR